ncbi:helix-turn-helix transcriptional regulator [Lagierella sp.]|uniref:helix-turn-helix transcriptional regulator n=1 Tax=Lagierella sp. TaxID=2849657 RepID=UPI002636366D|nr:helix-turn-helix transcriptional regulator [Lagierella sp.]
MKKLSQNKLKEIALRKISYDEVAENSSLSKNTINSLVNGQNFNPTLETLTKLSFSCGQDCVRLCQKNNYFNNTEVKKISRYIYMDKRYHSESCLKKLKEKTKKLVQLKDPSLFPIIKYNERYIRLFSFYLKFLKHEIFNYSEFKKAFNRLYNFSFYDPEKVSSNYFTREKIYFACLLLCRKRQFDRAIPILLNIIDSTIKDYYYLASLISLSKVYMNLGNFEKSIKLCNEGLEICVENDYAFDLVELFKIREHCVISSSMCTDECFYDDKRFESVNVNSSLFPRR